MAITVKFIGALRHVSGVNELALDFAEALSLKELIREIISRLPEPKRILFDQQFEDPRLTALILVNGREISALNGLETSLKDGDEVVLVPVVHGG